MIETLFICNPKTPATKNESSDRWQVLPSSSSENRVLDPKKSQNIAILLRALNVTKEEVCEGLFEGDFINLLNNFLYIVMCYRIHVFSSLTR